MPLLIVMAWLYVAVLMAVAEATNPIGSVLGAIVTFIFYGLLPASLLLYLLQAPARKRLRKEREAQELAAYLEAQKLADHPSHHVDHPEQGSGQPDAGSESASASKPSSVSPVRKEEH